MSSVKYTKAHEWVVIEGDQVTLGITDFAQEQLGDIVFIELPEAGAAVEEGAEVVVIESVKAAGEVHAPVSGTVVEVNETLADAPETVNRDPMGDGWFFKIQVSGEISTADLLSEEEYEQLLEEE